MACTEWSSWFGVIRLHLIEIERKRTYNVKPAYKTNDIYVWKCADKRIVTLSITKGYGSSMCCSLSLVLYRALCLWYRETNFVFDPLLAQNARDWTDTETLEKSLASGRLIECIVWSWSFSGRNTTHCGVLYSLVVYWITILNWYNI